MQVKLIAQDGSAQRMDLHVGLIALLTTVVCNAWIAFRFDCFAHNGSVQHMDLHVDLIASVCHFGEKFSCCHARGTLAMSEFS